MSKNHFSHSLNSRDLFLNLRRLVKITKPLRFENKSLRLKYKCLICIWIIFWAILDLFINPKYLFQNKSFSQTYYFKSEKSFVILTSLLGLKINPGNLESTSIHIAYLMHSLHAHTLLPHQPILPPHKSTSPIYLQITSPSFYAYCRLTMLTTVVSSIFITHGYA